MNVHSSSEKQLKWKRNISVITVVILLDNLLSFAMTSLNVPYFLDSLFSIFCGLAFGPLAGLLTGLFSNTYEIFFWGFPGWGLLETIINIMAGLLSGLLVHKNISSVRLVVTLILASTVVATGLCFIVTAILPDLVCHHLLFYIVISMKILGLNHMVAYFLAFFIIHFIDKAISVSISYGLYRISRRSSESKLNKVQP